MTHPWLPAPLFTMLCEEAVTRGLHVDQLAAKLLEAIIEDKMYAALLDL